MWAYSRMPIYEEGLFAYITIYQPSKPDFGLIARIDGEEKLILLEHPSFLYETMKIGGKFADIFVDFNVLDELQKTHTLRILFSLFPLAVYFAIFFVIIKSNWNKINQRFNKIDYHLRYSLLFILLTLPLPLSIVTSTELQVDGSVGVLMVGTFALSIFISLLKNTSVKFRYSILFVGAFVVALGKNEWTLGLVVVILTQFVLLLFLNVFHKNKTNKSLISSLCILAVIASGVLAGNLVSYLYDPTNYLAGIDVMLRITKASNTKSENLLEDLTKLTDDRFPYIFPIVLILMVTIYLLLKNRKRLFEIPTQIFVLFGYAAVLFGSYSLSLWNPEPRYFAPAFTVSIVLYLALIECRLLSSKKLLTFVLIILASQAFYFVYSNPKIYFPQNGIASVEAKECIQIMDIARVYDKKIDFVANSLSRKDAENIVKQYNKSLCN